MTSILSSKPHLIDIPTKGKHKPLAIGDYLHMVLLDYITNYDLNIFGLFKTGNEIGFSN